MLQTRLLCSWVLILMPLKRVKLAKNALGSHFNFHKKQVCPGGFQIYTSDCTLYAYTIEKDKPQFTNKLIHHQHKSEKPQSCQWLLGTRLMQSALQRYSEYYDLKQGLDFTKTQQQTSIEITTNFAGLLDMIDSLAQLVTVKETSRSKDSWQNLSPNLRLQVCVFGFIPDLQFLSSTIQDQLMSTVLLRCQKSIFFSESERCQLIRMADTN